MLLALRIVLLAGSLSAVPMPHSATQPVAQFRPSGFYDGAWPVLRSWDARAEQEFARFVQAIGTARERKAFRLAQGLRNPDVNPYWEPEDAHLRFEADCATFAYALRAYFAYKTRRPFSFIANKGRRYRYGNRPLRFGDQGQYPDFQSLLRATLSAVSSGHFRMNAHLEGTDTYPVRVTPESIRPGVTYYDPAGHVLVVYRVEPDSGDVHLIDGHPDGTVTLKVLNPRIHRGSTRSGGGFRAWRPVQMQLVDEVTGAYRVFRTLNRDLPDYSATEQYRDSYSLGGLKLTFHDWVRTRLSRSQTPFTILDRFHGRFGRLRAAFGRLQITSHFDRAMRRLF